MAMWAVRPNHKPPRTHVGVTLGNINPPSWLEATALFWRFDRDEPFESRIRVVYLIADGAP